MCGWLMSLGGCVIEGMKRRVDGVELSRSIHVCCTIGYVCRFDLCLCLCMYASMYVYE